MIWPKSKAKYHVSWSGYDCERGLWEQKEFWVLTARREVWGLQAFKIIHIVHKHSNTPTPVSCFRNNWQLCDTGARSSEKRNASPQSIIQTAKTSNKHKILNNEMILRLSFSHSMHEHHIPMFSLYVWHRRGRRESHRVFDGRWSSAARINEMQLGLELISLP